MDAVAGENLRGSKARSDYVFAGLRNVVENQVAKAVSNDLARYLLTHLERDTFFLGKLDQADALPAHKELRRLLDRFESSAPMPPPVAFPRYSSEKLAFAIQEAAQNFRKPWRARLGIEAIADTPPYPWQSIKAMTRRQAEGLDDGYPIRPASNFLNALISAISRFLETPLGWNGQPTDEEKREVIDRIKMLVTKECGTLSRQRLRERPQPEWRTAYDLRGAGSTLVRRMQVETIYEKWVPIPHSGGDKETQVFLDEIKHIVLGAVQAVEDQVKAASAVKKQNGGARAEPAGVASAIAELEAAKLVGVSHEVGGGAYTFRSVKPTSALFWLLDLRLNGWEVRRDAHEIARIAVDSGRSVVALEALDELLKWSARRINPAAAYLVARCYAQGSREISPTYSPRYLKIHAGTKAFADSSMESTVAHRTPQVRIPTTMWPSHLPARIDLLPRRLLTRSQREGSPRSSMTSLRRPISGARISMRISRTSTRSAPGSA